jgi:hypothetical protein
MEADLAEAHSVNFCQDLWGDTRENAETEPFLMSATAIGTNELNDIQNHVEDGHELLKRELSQQAPGGFRRHQALGEGDLARNDATQQTQLRMARKPLKYAQILGDFRKLSGARAVVSRVQSKPLEVPVELRDHAPQRREVTLFCRIVGHRVA